MKIIELKCPNCNASLEVNAEKKQMYCQYCGTKIIIDDEIKRSETTVILRDEAGIKEAEAYERIALGEIELERNWQDNRKKSLRRWRKSILFLLILGLVLLLLSVAFKANEETHMIIMAVGLMLISISLLILVYGGLGYFIALLVHNRRNK